MKLETDHYSVGLRQSNAIVSQSESSVKTSSKFNSGFMEKRRKVKQSLNMDRFKIKQFDLTSETSNNLLSGQKNQVLPSDKNNENRFNDDWN